MSDNFDAAKLEKLGAQAASIGADYKARGEAFEAAAKTRKEAASLARDSSNADDTKRGGFDTAMFQGLSAVAAAFGRLYGNGGDTGEARAAAELAARSFSASFTGATEKTAKGGTMSGYVAHIMLGQAGESVRLALQSRLDHYAESVAAKTDAKERAEAAKIAARYCTPCGDTPNADGSFPVSKDGKVRVPKHNGRPASNVNGVAIEAGRGTDRKSQFAALSRLYVMHGAKCLHPDVVDAFLDNGGKYITDKSVTHLATEARDLLEKLLLAGGNMSGDSSFLTVGMAHLSRIAESGFKSAHVAAAPAPVVNITPATDAGDVAGAKSDDSGDNAESNANAGNDATVEVSEGEAKQPRRRRASTGGL